MPGGGGGEGSLLKSKIPSVRGMVVTFRVQPKDMIRSKCQSTDLDVPVRGKKKFSDYAHKTEFSYLLQVLFEIFDDHPRHFYMGTPPLPGVS